MAFPLRPERGTGYSFPTNKRKEHTQRKAISDTAIAVFRYMLYEISCALYVHSGHGIYFSVALDCSYIIP